MKKEKEINPTQESFAETYIMDRILNNYNEYYFYDDEFSDNDIIDELVIEDDDDFTDNDVVAEPVIEDDDRVIPDLSDDVPF